MESEAKYGEGTRGEPRHNGKILGDKRAGVKHHKGAELKDNYSKRGGTTPGIYRQSAKFKWREIRGNQVQKTGCEEEIPPEMKFHQ